MQFIIKRVDIFITFNFILLFTNCTNNRSQYLKQIPDIDKYTIIDKSMNAEESKSLLAELWYNPENLEDHYLSSIKCLEEVGDYIWICDPMKSEVVSYTEDGQFHKQILGKGKGPLEVVYPSASFSNNSDSIFYIYDSDQTKILGLTKEGDLKQVITSKFLPSGVLDNSFKSVNRNSFYWNTYSKQNYSLFEWDSLGKPKQGLVKRIIPLGYNPVTHNAVTFDIKNNLFVYAYKGLPLVFIENESDLNVINLLPNTKLEEINTDLTPIPFSVQKMTSVNNLIRSIDIAEDKIYINYLSTLLIYDLNMESLKKFEFIDADEKELKFHKMHFTDKYIYISNSFNLKIHRLSINELGN